MDYLLQAGEKMEGKLQGMGADEFTEVFCHFQGRNRQ
jgi:hypothetical protein